MDYRGKVGRFPLDFLRLLFASIIIIIIMQPSAVDKTNSPPQWKIGIQQIQRKFFSSSPGSRPADAAAAAMGRSLAHEWIRDKLQQKQQQQQKQNQGRHGRHALKKQHAASTTSQDDDIVFDTLSNAQIHPSIPQAFFDSIIQEIQQHQSSSSLLLPLDCCLSQWVVRLEKKQQQLQQQRQDNHHHAATLTACIRAYAAHLVAVTANATRTDQISQDQVHRAIQDTLQRVTLPSSRQLLAQEIIQAAIGNHQRSPSVTTLSLPQATRYILSPVLASTLLHNGTNNNNRDPHQHQTAAFAWWVWKSLHRLIWYRWSTTAITSIIITTTNIPTNHLYSVLLQSEQQHWLSWTLTLLDLYTTSASSNGTKSGSCSVDVDLIEQMWFDWIEWATAAMVSDGNNNIGSSTISSSRSLPLQQKEQQWKIRMLQQVLHWYLPRLLATTTTNFSWSNYSTVVDAVTDLFSSCATQQQPHLSGPACLGWVTQILTTVSSQERLAVLHLLWQCCRTASTTAVVGISANLPMNHVTHSLLLTASSILPHMDPDYPDVAVSLLQSLRSPNPSTDAANHMPSSACRNDLLELFGPCADQIDNEDKHLRLLQMVAGIRSFSGTKFSVRQQTAALLFGVVWMIDVEEDRRTTALFTDDDGFNFLRTLLITYPHLAVSLLSVILEKIDNAGQNQDGAALMRYLEFLCGSLVANSHCAKEVWNLVGVQWMKPHAPLTLRITLMRLFPKLVAGNKRMYRRVMDCVGICLAGQEVEMRLAAAATLADLAADDNIRDVSDVIAWIQTLLTVEQTDFPIHTLLVHYALLSLHHLVVAEELDFDVVIKVLNKKLCSVTDHAAILKQPLVVIEALVLLLGDGECGGKDDGDEGGNDEDNGDGQGFVSPQVSSAVDALLHIGKAIRELPCEDAISDHAIIRIRKKVFDSLSKYSFDALGVDEDGMKLAVSCALGEGTNLSKEKVNRYAVLRDLIVTEMIELPVGGDEQEHDDCALMDLTARLVEFEEDIFGASLWQKRGRSLKQAAIISATAEQDLTPEKEEKSPFDLRDVLPQLSSVHGLADEGPSPATSIALLLSSDGSQLSLLRDHADSSLEATDPLFLLFCIQGYLHTASRLLSKQPHCIDSMLTEMRSWYEIFVSPDALFLALSCFSIFIPFELHQDGSDASYVEDIYDTVMTAFKNNEFEKGDVAKICIGLSVVSSFRFTNLERLSGAVSQLEQTVRGYGGEQTFGAYYGLALIAQACSKYVRDDVECQISAKEIEQLICRVNGFILEELVACFESNGVAIKKLVSCTKRGKISSNLIDSLLNLGPNSIPLLNAKQDIARFLFLSCAVCFPSLASVNTFLLLAVFRFLESLEWGSGKGVALPSVVRACEMSGVMKDDLLEQVHSSYVAAFKERFDLRAGDDDPHVLEDLFFSLKGVHWAVCLDAVYQVPVGNQNLFGNNGGVLPLIASVLSITSLSCFGTAWLESLSQLDDNVDDDDINTVVELLFETISLNGENERGAMGKILMGLLSSIGDPESHEGIEDEDEEPQLSPRSTDPAGKPGKDDAISSTDDIRSEASVSTTDNSIIQLDFDKLPSPQLGTVLAGIRDGIEGFCETANANSPQNAMLSRALRSLQRLSIPDKYAKAFLEPLVRENAARDACINLLCSQISMRRRAYSDGRSFATFATQVCMAPDEAWHRWLGHGNTQHVFVARLADLGPKLPADIVNDCMNNLLDKCLLSTGPTRTIMFESFLSIFSQLLNSTAVSPKAMRVFRELSHGRLFDDVCSMQLDTTMARSGRSSIAIFDLYVRCLKEVPHSYLDEIRFFRLCSDSVDEFYVESFRAILVLKLIETRYFDFELREVKELTSVASWLSRSILASSGQERRDTFRRVACVFSTVMLNELTAAKRDRLIALLDLLLLTDTSNCQAALEWLAVVLAYWCAGQDSNGDMSLGYLCTIESAAAQALPPHELAQFFQVVMNSFCSNLAEVAHREKLITPISNQLHRLFKHWSNLNIDKGTLDYVQHAVIRCHSGATGEDAFVSLASSILAAVS